MFNIELNGKETKKVVIIIVMILVIIFSLILFIIYQQSKLQEDKVKLLEDLKKSTDQNERKVVFVQKSINYYFHRLVHESVKRAVETRGWEFQSTVADFNSARQINQFVNYIPMKPDCIITNPIDSEALIDVINEAGDSEIPVCIVDTPTSGGNVELTVSFDNFLAGEMAAIEIVKRLREKYGKVKGTVFNGYGELYSRAYRLRKNGFESVIKQYPDIHYIAMPGEGDLAKTHDVFVDALAKNKNIDAVHCPSDTPARGIVEGLKHKGKWKKSGEPGHIIFVTIDGDPAAVKYVEEGYYDASIVQDAISYGEIVVELLEKYILNGQRVPVGLYRNDKYYWKIAMIKDSISGPYFVIPPYVMDKNNYSDSRHWANIAETEWGFEYR